MSLKRGDGSLDHILILMSSIVKIQALARGYLVRLKINKIRKVLRERLDKGEFDDSISEASILFN